VAIKGFDKVKANMNKVIRDIDVETGRFLRLRMELVITEAKTLCPVKYGVLRSSGRADGPKKSLKTTTVEGSFGQGPSGKYALYVHEGVGLRHTVGQPKFLEQPFKESERTLFRDVSEAVARKIATKG